MSDNAIKSTTQEFLDVYDIVNDMVLLKDGTAAVILQIGTMNFSLLAEQEQDAVIFTYGSLLNSLNYPIQINIQSQTKDATKYLRLLDEQISKSNSDRKAALIKQYRDFVAALIKERNVLQKRFFIVVPASPAEMGLITPSSVIPGKTAFDIASVEKSILIEKATNLLEPRKEHLTSQFNRLGLYARQLSTQEIIQNFYINYNPEAAEGQEISSSENYTTPLVRASFGGKIMQLNDQTNASGQIINQNQVVGQSPVQPNPAAQTASQFTPEEIIGSASAPANNDQQLENNQVAQPITPITEQASTLSEPIGNVPTEPAALTPNPIPATEIAMPVAQAETQNIQETQVAQAIQQAPISSNNETESNLQNNILDNGLNSNLTEQNLDLGSISPTPVENPTEQIATTAEQAQDLNLNLDANLIQNTPTETTPTDAAYSESLIQMDNSVNSPEPIQQVPASQPAEPALNSTGDSFVEEITPLQNKFEAQVVDNSQPATN